MNGVRTDKKLASQMAEAAAALQHTRDALEHSLDRGELSDDAYADQLISATASYMERARVILRPARYAALFGSDSTDPSGILDRETFLLARQSEQPLLRN